MSTLFLSNVFTSKPSKPPLLDTVAVFCDSKPTQSTAVDCIAVDCGSAPRAQSGFTLIELLIVIAIVAIIVVIAGPGIKNTLEKQRNIETTQTLLSILREAKTESMLRRQDITVSYYDQQVTLTAPDPMNVGSKLTLRTWNLPEGTPVSANNAALIFRTNKSVKITSANAQGYATYDTSCNKTDGRAGRSVQVDSNGNIFLDESKSVC